MKKERLEQFNKYFGREWNLCSDSEKNEIVEYLDETLNNLIDFYKKKDRYIEKCIDEVKDYIGTQTYEKLKELVDKEIKSDKNVCENIKKIEDIAEKLEKMEYVRHFKAKVFYEVYNLKNIYGKQLDFDFIEKIMINFREEMEFEHENNIQFDDILNNSSLEYKVVEYLESIKRVPYTNCFERIKAVKDKYFEESYQEIPQA